MDWFLSSCRNLYIVGMTAMLSRLDWAVYQCRSSDYLFCFVAILSLVVGSASASGVSGPKEPNWPTREHKWLTASKIDLRQSRTASSRTKRCRDNIVLHYYIIVYIIVLYFLFMAIIFCCRLSDDVAANTMKDRVRFRPDPWKVRVASPLSQRPFCLRNDYRNCYKDL